MVTEFRPGDVLIIVPADTDDPEAERLKGERCRFLRYHVSGHGVVELDGRKKPIFFRPSDLRKEVPA